MSIANRRLSEAMAVPRILAISLILGTLISLGDGVPPARADGCSYGPPEDPNERLKAAMKQGVLILVGVVLDETRVENDDSTPDPRDFKPSIDQSDHDKGGVFRSTIDVEAVLKGEVPAGELELTHLSDVWLCVGGPRLREERRYLLFLHQAPTWSNPSGPKASSGKRACLAARSCSRRARLTWTTTRLRASLGRHRHSSDQPTT
jgi:hypothetical protein